MLRIVTSNSDEVPRHLGASAFSSLEVEHHVATRGAALLDLARRVAPDLVLVDAELDGESGFGVCDSIKRDPALSRTHVILLLSRAISRAELDSVRRSGCDDVLALPVSSDDFYHHLAQLCGLPLRRAPRVGVELEVTLPDRVEATHGTIMNVSGNGLGVRLTRPLVVGHPVTARLRHGEHGCDLPTRVVWSRPAEPPEPGYLAGLEPCDDLPMRTRLLLEELSLWDVVPDPDRPDGVLVVIHGDLTEAIDLAPLARRLVGQRHVVFDMAGVRYISSAGIKAWCDLIGGLDGVAYSFRHCSLAFASQAAMVPMVLGDGVVTSLEAPFHCERCRRDDLRLLEIGALLVEDRTITPPCLRCVGCGGELEFDDVPDRYFAFLRGAP